MCGLVMPIARSQARKAMPPIQKAAHRQQTYEGTLEMLQGPEKKEGLKGPLCGGLKQAGVCQICRGGRWSPFTLIVTICL